ncbi:MAG: alkaline phosphatase family protein [Nanoarchaeota archaeon]
MKKFVAIQVDGLSYRRLMDACHNSTAPFLATLLKGKYKAYRYNCGLPSNTPFAQSGILYGKNDCIPGFRFVDKKLKKEFKVTNPLNMLFIEHTYLADRKGILTNGSSYSNIFSGGARYSRFTGSQLLNMKSRLFFKQFDILLFLLSPKTLFRVLYFGTLNTLTLLQIFHEWLVSLFSKYKTSSDLKYDITKFFSSVFIEELEADSLIKDMKKGVPYLYITFNGYDENSHHQGPTSPAAQDALKTIDKKIERIFQHKNDYDIYILSDHGHTESVPFKSLYGTTFPRYIKSLMKKYTHERRPHLFTRARKKMKVAGILLHPLALIETGIHRLLAKTSILTQASWHSHPYFLEVSDCMANLYFNYTDEKTSMTEIEERYPGFLDRLKSHPGIGMVFGMDAGKVRVLNREGEAILGKEDNDHTFIGKRFLKDYGDESILITQLQYFARMHNSGDLIIFGDYSKHDVISFINHYGSHGSAGGEQMHPFFMSEKTHDFTQTTNVKDLYDVFIQYHT